MAFAAITDAEIDPDSPITTGLMTKYRDNQEWVYYGTNRAFARKTANVTINNDNTVNNDPDLVLAGLASGTYVVHAMLQFTWTVNNGVRVRFVTSDPANDTGECYMPRLDMDGGGHTGQGDIQAINVDCTSGVIGAGGVGWTHIWAYVTFDADPSPSSLIVAWAQDTSHADNLTLHQDSFVWMTRLDQW